MLATKNLSLLINENQSYQAFTKYNSIRKFLNLILTEYHKKLRHSYLYSYPYKGIVDVNNVCNLQCVHCPTGKRETGRQKGFMAFAEFQKIVDELGKYLYILDLFNWGEPFLNKEIFEMIEYAEQRNICTNIHSNFNIKFNADIAERLVQSGLSYLTISLDGADEETYPIYRKGGNFEKVLENARLLIDTKNKLNKQKPYITWQFLVFPHNKHQIDQANQMAHELGFDSFRVLAGITTDKLADITTGNSDDEVSKMKDIEKTRCDWLWTTATFNWDMSVSPCCLEFKEKDDFGSINHAYFKDTWNNEKFVYARSLFAHGESRLANDDEIICSRCFKLGGLS